MICKEKSNSSIFLRFWKEFSIIILYFKITGKVARTMAENDYFKQALSNFVFDMASGGAIQHLANQGYTVKQIIEKLDFPASYEKVQEAVWKQLLSNGCLLLEEPGSGAGREKIEYVMEKDSFGKRSFRQVIIKADETKKIHWKEIIFNRRLNGEFSDYLSKQVVVNGEEASYVSCDFGVRANDALDILNEQQREYILGLPWTNQRVYHKLDMRMREIVSALYDVNEFQGECYFIKTEERVIL